MFYDFFINHSKEQNRAYLTAYLNDFGYRDEQLKEIYPLYEHEACFYYKTDKLFIKITPRVKREIQHLHSLTKQNFSFLLPTLFGTSEKKGILITPAISAPHFMVEMADQLLLGKIALGEFLAFELRVLNKLNELHQSEVFSHAAYPQYSKFLIHSWEQLRKVPFIEMPIRLDETFYPSIKEMVERALLVEETLTPIKGHLIHGEFSHTNVGIDADNLIIYDWEKMRRNGDPCWDIAKWIKYFNYFYLVQKARKNHLELPDDLLQIKNNKIFIHRVYPEFPFKEQIMEQLILFFAEKHKVSIKEIKKRVFLGLFLSSVYSLNASIIKFKKTTSLTVVNLINSFFCLVN